MIRVYLLQFGFQTRPAPRDKTKAARRGGSDGNDMQQVLDALHAPACPGKPRLIHLHTLKGKGVSFMEGQVGWHGKAPNAEQTAQALSELEG